MVRHNCARGMKVTARPTSDLRPPTSDLRLFRDPKPFKKALPPGTRLLGVDLGTRSIGLALSDPGLMVASPAETLRRRTFTKDFARMAALMETESVGGLVIGYPLQMDGTPGTSCHRVMAFIDEVQKRIGHPALLWDERLTSAQAKRPLIEQADLSRARQAELVDKMAAGLILQSALDALSELH